MLGRIQELVKNYVEKSKVMSTTEGLQGLMTHYQTKFADLYVALKPEAPGTAQDKAKAALRLQHAIADDAWGGRKCCAVCVGGGRGLTDRGMAGMRACVMLMSFVCMYTPTHFQ